MSTILGSIALHEMQGPFSWPARPDPLASKTFNGNAWLQQSVGWSHLLFPHPSLATPSGTGPLFGTPLNFDSFHLKVWDLASSCISPVQFPLVNFDSEHLHGTMTLELPRFAPPFLTSRVFVKARIRYACWCEVHQVHEQEQKATLGPRLWHTMKQS